MRYQIKGGPLDGGEIEGPEVPIGAYVKRAVVSGVRDPFTQKVTPITDSPTRIELYRHYDIGDLRYERTYEGA